MARKVDAIVAPVALGDDEGLFEGRPGERELSLLLVAVCQIEQGSPAGIELMALLELWTRLRVLAGVGESSRFVVQGLRGGRVATPRLRARRSGGCRCRDGYQGRHREDGVPRRVAHDVSFTTHAATCGHRQGAPVHAHDGSNRLFLNEREA